MSPLRTLLLITILFMVASPAGARQTETGFASWYNRGYHGLPTSNGERYDHEAMTAAHRTLAFGSLVRVTRLDDNRSVIVRINDRMASGPGHIIDLSGAAAREMDLLKVGVARVRIDVIGQSATNPPAPSVTTSAGPAPPTGQTQASVPAWSARPTSQATGPVYAEPPSSAAFTLQLGAYSRRDTAERMATLYPDAYIVTASSTNGAVYRVFYRSFVDEAAARAEQARLWNEGQDSFLRRL